MDPISAISLIASLIVSAMSAGISINQLNIAGKNQQLRAKIFQIISDINSQISKGRLSLNKIISLLQSKNQNALMNYLMNNPVISRNLEGIQKDSDMLASIQSEQSALESEIANLQSEINALGYSQSISGAREEDSRLVEKKAQLIKAKDKYQDLVNKAEKVEISTTNPTTINTHDIDARSQNINGGLNNNVQTR